MQNTKPLVRGRRRHIRAAEEEKIDRTCPKLWPADGRQERADGALPSPARATPSARRRNPNPNGVPCPEPGCTGELVERRNKRGKVFYGCNRFPECRFTASLRPQREECPPCDRLRAVVGEGDKRRVLCRELDACIRDKAK